MSSNKKNIKYLCIGIILIIGITGAYLLYYFLSNSPTINAYENVGIFDSPDRIELFSKGKMITLLQTDSQYDELVKLNRARDVRTHYYQGNYVYEVGVDSEEIILRYCYDDIVSVAVPMRLEDAIVSARNISFILTGDGSFEFVINEQPSVIYTGLDVNIELIEYAESLLTDSSLVKDVEEKTNFFEMPTEIWLQLDEKGEKIVITPKHELFDNLVRANERRLISSFYSYSSNEEMPRANEWYAVYYYDSPIELIIPFEKDQKSVVTNRIIFLPATDRFIVETNGEYVFYTGMTVSNNFWNLMRKGFVA